MLRYRTDTCAPENPTCCRIGLTKPVPPNVRLSIACYSHVLQNLACQSEILSATRDFVHSAGEVFETFRAVSHVSDKRGFRGTHAM
jgi:hypothetical protein